MGSTFYLKRYRPHVGRGRAKRAKTFASEEAAKKWATAQKLGTYTLVNLKSTESSTKKIKIVLE